MRLFHVHRPNAEVAPRSHERGAGIVEFALVALLLFTLSAGAFDYGQAWRSGLTVNEAARTGARVGTAGGKERAADFNALSGLKASLESGGVLDDVKWVIVFRADSLDGDLPAGCDPTKSLTGPCHVLTGNQLRSNWEAGSVATATDSNGCLKIAQRRSWCPTGRTNDQSTADYYGVWVQMEHEFLFPIMGDSTKVARTAVMRLEPAVK